MNYLLVNFWSKKMEDENLQHRSQISHFGALQRLGHTILTILKCSELKNFNVRVFLGKSYVSKVLQCVHLYLIHFDEAGIQNYQLFFKKLIWQFCFSMSKWLFGCKTKVLSLLCGRWGQGY